MSRKVRRKAPRLRRPESHKGAGAFFPRRPRLRRRTKQLFAGPKGITTESISRAIGAIINQAGLTGVTPYSLRHTFITGLLDAGAALRYVMDRAGHRRLSTTTRYLHVTREKDSPVKKIRCK